MEILVEKNSKIAIAQTIDISFFTQQKTLTKSSKGM
jgi:hypothetical protein